MKKALFLILVLVLCLPLCACGVDQKPAGTAPSGTVPTGTTGVTTNPTGASTSPVTPTTIPRGDSTSGSHISDHPWMEDLYGTWEYDSEFSGYPGTVTIDADGTCIFGDGKDYTSQSYTWWVSEDGSSEELLKIMVNHGEEKAWMLEMHKVDGLLGYSISLWHYEFDDIYSPVPGCYLNLEKAQGAISLGNYFPIQEKEGMPSSVQFHEDSTCSIDGQQYGWELEIGNTYEDVTVLILEDSSEKYRLQVHAEKGTATLINGTSRLTYMDTSRFERVEITPENWNEYFELDETPSISKNEFGDVTGGRYNICYQLKKPFFERLFPVEIREMDGAIVAELRYIGCSAIFAVDPDKETVTISGLYPGTEVTEIFSSHQEEDRFTVGIKGIWIYGLDYVCPDGHFGYPTDISVLRVKGCLWLTKE